MTNKMIRDILVPPIESSVFIGVNSPKVNLRKVATFYWQVEMGLLIKEKINENL